MASTVLTFAWRAVFVEAHENKGERSEHYNLYSPTFGNEKVKFCIHAHTPMSKSRVKFNLFFERESTISEIVANIEYRTKADGEFTTVKEVLNSGSRYLLTYEDLKFEEKTFPHFDCDGHCADIEVKITYFDDETPSFLNTWNSPGSIKAVNHADTLCQNLAVFGAKSSFADVTLCTVADGKEFKVHSTILAMRSPVFAAMFAEGNFKESQEKKVNIEDFDGQVMGAFIDYLYGRKNTEWKSFACGLAKVADKYDVPSLFTACVTNLVADVNVENAAKSFYYAYQLGISNSMNEIAQFIVKNKTAVMATDGWKEYFFQDANLYDALYKAT